MWPVCLPPRVPLRFLGGGVSAIEAPANRGQQPGGDWRMLMMLQQVTGLSLSSFALEVVPSITSMRNQGRVRRSKGALPCR